jgi:uncharacterized protein YjbI with pentapeptide repeats
MANNEHVALLKQGVAAWAAWRRENPDVRPDLGEADLRKTDLRGADFSGADLRGADLSWANLSRADLSEAKLFNAALHQADQGGRRNHPHLSAPRRRLLGCGETGLH